MPLLIASSGKLKVMRSHAAILLTDKCDIYYQTLAQSGAGDGTRIYTLATANVPSRWEQIQFRSQQIESYAGREVMSIVYKVYFNYDFVLKPNYRLRFQGADYEIRVLENDQTDRIYNLAHVSRSQ